MPLFSPQTALAFVEGLGLVLSPCILPVLPFILAASATGSRARPYWVIAGFVISFAGFTLLSRQILALTGIQQDTIQYAAFALLLLLGITMTVPFLERRFASLTNGIANRAENLSRGRHSEGPWGGLLIGALIGVIWTPCAGPLLAAALLQVIQSQTDLGAAVTIFAFSLGAAVPMLIISIFGRQLAGYISAISKHASLFRRGMGVLIIFFAMLGLLGFNIGTWAVSSPSKTMAAANTETSTSAPEVISAMTRLAKAPEITGITKWFNSEPLTISQLKGKVVLIDFWTYSCINCIRTLPYIKSWHEKYKDQGLVIIGVHAPEFPFEGNPDNVAAAIKKFAIPYPVAMDNNFATWRNYNNRYWPAHYLIDRDGNLVDRHFGEGGYVETENKIRTLLNIAPKKETGKHVSMTSAGQTPETYLGASRAANFVSPESRKAEQTYTFPQVLGRHEWALQGAWQTQGDNIVSAGDNAQLKLRFLAGKVFLVLGSRDGKPVTVRVHLEGTGPNNSPDIHGETLLVTEHRLYELARLKDVTDGVLTLTAEKPGLEAYAFTFGK
ncbi:MAG: cytochrome c biogenesis protein DipZ [Alphaproteobacteria bacterium]